MTRTYGDIYARRGTLVRLIYLAVALAFWVFSGFGCLNRRRVVVLCYHGVTTAEKRRFAWQMARIAKRAVDTPVLSSLLAGRWRLPAVCVTFDDGFASLLESALPVMRDLGVPATVFAVPANAGLKPRWQMPAGHPEADEVLMSFEQMTTAVREGLCRFGSHTLSHCNLLTVPSPVVRHELAASKSALEKLPGVCIEDVALPYGAGDQRVIQEALAVGYRRIHTLAPSLHRNGTADLVVGRFSMSPDVWRIEFLLTCAGAYAWLHLWRRFVKRLRTAPTPSPIQEPQSA